MATYDMFIPLVAQLLSTKQLTTQQLVAALSTQPAHIAQTQVPSIAVGQVANFTLIDLQHQWQLDADSQVSQGTNQALNLQQLTGRTRLTWNNGQISYNR